MPIRREIKKKISNESRLINDAEKAGLFSGLLLNNTAMTKRKPIDRISPQAAEALVEFLACDNIRQIKILQRNFLLLYAREGENPFIPLDENAYYNLNDLLDALELHGLIDDD